MQVEELLAKLEENASAAQKPVTVEIPNVGTVYVRKRTVLEYEQMATLQKQVEASGQDNGLFAPSIARLLCNEEGKRFDIKTENALAKALAGQPEEVFHAIVNASDGVRKLEETVEVAEGMVKEGEEPVPN